MRVTFKTSREDIVRALGVNAKVVQKVDKSVYDQMVYTSRALKKDEKSVTKKDLADLLKEVMKVLGDKFIDPFKVPAVAETKAPEKVSDTAKTTKKESSLKKTAVATKVAPKTEGKPVAEVKKPAPVKKVEPREHSRYLAQIEDFPEVLKIEGEEFERADDIKNMKSVYEALEKDTELVFAFYWNARQIKQFNYFDGQVECPKSFKDNLDLCTVIYASDAFKVAYAVSMYTEACYRVLPSEIPTYEDTNVRLSNGIDFNIYRKKVEKKEVEKKAESKKLTGTPKKTPEAVPAGTVDKNGTVNRKTKKTTKK